MGTLAFFGTYDPQAPRNVLLQAAWEASGGQVIAVNEPLWPANGDRAMQASGARLLPWAMRWLAAQRALSARAAELAPATAILVPYPGHLDMPLATWLARRGGQALLFDPFLSLHDTAVGDRALFAESSWQASGARAADGLSLRLASRVLADTPAQASFYQALARLAPERLAVVPVGADGRLFYPRPAFPTSPGCEVLFYGHMSPLHGIETILAAAQLLAPDPSVRFHLVGSGQFPIAERLAALQLPNVRHTPTLPYAGLPAAIARAHMALGLFGRSPKAARVVPHKLYEAAAMGQAIVTADTPAVREAFGPEALALVPAGDAEALAATLRALSADPARRAALGESARSRFLAAYDLPGLGAALQAAVRGARGRA